LSTNQPEFNLLDEPWILVSDLAGSQKKVSMLELFEKAQCLRMIDGESETQNISILRLCLAVLHTVIARYDMEGKENPLEDEIDGIDRWGEWWNSGQLPFPIIRDYLGKWHSRFDLFDADHPFYQDAEVGRELAQEYEKKPKEKDITENGIAKNYYSAGKLIGDLSESGNKVRNFRMTNVKSLAFDEAARWLVNYLNTDDKSAKQPTPKKCGSLGEIGCVTVHGNNLFETLMLNLVLKNVNEDDIPVWERTDSIRENNAIAVKGLANLYTMQTRRVFLDQKNERIIGIKSKAGEYVEKVPLTEPMTAWVKDKNGGQSDFMPKKHNPAVALWRNLSILLLDSEIDKKPGVMNWAGKLIEEAILNERTTLNIRTVGISYATMSASIDDIYTDSIGFTSILLKTINEELRNATLEQVNISRKFAERYADFEKELYLASGGDEENQSEVRNEARGKLYSQMDLPFRRWLLKVGTEYVSSDDIRNSWWNIVCKIARNSAEDLIKQQDDSAILGKYITRNVKGTEIREKYSAARAYNRFLYYTTNRETLFKEGKSKHVEKK